ncbi:MAG: response regulator transcription factor [bacterium]|nr:response regulator transcription factor [bacterium]
MKKIMIVEDDKEVARELLNLLINSNYDATILEDFFNAKDIILKSKSDLILLDINIPYLNGELLLKSIRKESNIPVIMITSKVSETDEVLSISYGADDYITKPYNPTILLLRISNIFKRYENCTDLINYKELSINLAKGIITSDIKQVILTKNEMIIFNYLFNNKDRIVSRDELMTELWNNDEYINDNALTVNISRLRSKLEELNSSIIIETRKGIGYILV